MKLSALKNVLVLATVVVGSLVFAGGARAEVFSGESIYFIGDDTPFSYCNVGWALAHYGYVVQNAKNKALTSCEATTGKKCKLAEAIDVNSGYSSAQGRSCSIIGYAYPDPTCNPVCK